MQEATDSQYVPEVFPVGGSRLSSYPGPTCTSVDCFMRPKKCIGTVLAGSAWAEDRQGFGWVETVKNGIPGKAIIKNANE